MPSVRRTWLRADLYVTHITIQDGSFFEAFRFVVVVDTKLLEQNLILIRRDCARKFLLRFLRAHAALLNKSPESCVVQIVDVT